MRWIAMDAGDSGREIGFLSGGNGWREQVMTRQPASPKPASRSAHGANTPDLGINDAKLVCRYTHLERRSGSRQAACW